MKWTLVYFDDQGDNIECYNDILEDDFIIIGNTDPHAYRQILEQNSPHAFLIDVHMPLMDGFTLYEKIMAHPQYNGCPIFFISGDESDENKIKSYKSGGIDFIPRGLRAEELVLRLSNKIKKYLQVSTKLELGNLKIDVESLKVIVAGEMIDITLLEMRILCILIRELPETLTREDIIKRIWGEEPVKPGTINTHLTNLRPKMDAWNYSINIKKNFVLVTPKDQ